MHRKKPKEVERELIRVACLLQSLLRDIGLMKETMGHLEDERHCVQEKRLGKKGEHIGES